MTTYYPHKIRLSDGQKVSLARAFGPGEAVTLRFKNEALTGGSDTLHLTERQIKKIQRAIKNKTGADIDLSKTQIREIRKLARGDSPHGGSGYASKTTQRRKGNANQPTTIYATSTVYWFLGRSKKSLPSLMSL